MSRFLIVYRGAPGGEESEGATYHSAAWDNWFERLGPALVDRGGMAPSSVEIPSRLRGPKLSSSALSGYSVVEAEDFDAAVRIAEECPIFDEKGSVEIARLN